MPEYLPAVEIEPKGAARASVIWLHGLGADGHDFEPIVPYLGLDPGVGVRFVFPHAPALPVTINMGAVMPAWYDIQSLDLRHDADIAGIRRSATAVRDLIARENERGVPSARILLAGFSQGGAIALHVALRHAEPLAGVLALSTYLVLADALPEERAGANAAIPIFQAHGTGDPMVPFDRGEMSRRRLEQLGYPVEWHAYPMAHEVIPEEIRDVGAWLGRVLAAPPRTAPRSPAGTRPDPR